MKKLTLLLATAILMSACVKTTEPTRFSILGDSYSTFEGYVDPETYNVWEHYAEIGVTGVEQMWWKQVADSTGWLLDRNNSFSGALICNYDEFHHGDHYGPYSFIRRMNNLGNPNVIFIFGGTNDVWKGAPFGDYVYSDWTEEQLCTFRPALANLLDNVKRQYPKAKIYFLLETNPCPGGITEETRLNLVESTHVITSHYNVDCIDLDIHKSMWHPDPEGQKNIADQVLEHLAADIY
jgi:lysophospholipase L1-like esterase